MPDFSKICLSYAATLYFVGAKGGILTDQFVHAKNFQSKTNRNKNFKRIHCRLFKKGSLQLFESRN